MCQFAPVPSSRIEYSMTTIHRPCMQDALAIAVEMTRPHSGYWIGTVARRFGIDYDLKTTDEYVLRGQPEGGGAERFARLIGLQPGLVVMEPASRDLMSHRGLLHGRGSFYTTMMFVPAAERNLTVMAGFDPSLPGAAAIIKCTGGATAIKLGLSAEQWNDLNRWLNFWLPE